MFPRHVLRNKEISGVCEEEQYRSVLRVGSTYTPRPRAPAVGTLSQWPDLLPVDVLHCEYLPNTRIVGNSVIIIYLAACTGRNYWRIFRPVLKKKEKRLLASSCPSVRPHETTRLPLDGFSCNLIFEDFSKICRKNSSFIKMWQEWRVLYMKTDILVHCWSYLAHFFLEWEMFQTKVVEKIKTHT